MQLIQAGDPAASLLTILSGLAFRYSMLPNGRRQILGIYLLGDTIGLDTLLTGAPAFTLAGADVETVHLNRVLQRLKARKLVALAAHRVTLLDMGSLECLALRPSPAAELRQAS